MNGWTYREILVFVAFSEMFFGFEQNVFGYATEFWMVVYSGGLDGQLTRPFDPRARFLLLNMDFLGLILSFIKVGVILAVSRVHLSAWKIAVGILIVLVANYVLMLMRFICNYLSFRLGKMDAIRQLCDCITKFNKYPLVIFPWALRIVMITIVPFYFFSTFSAQFVLGKLDGVSIFWMLLALAGNVVLWSILNNIAWKRGRMRYESLNG